MTSFNAPDPAASLEKLLGHAGLPHSREQCQVALDAVWENRGDYRFNKGVSGRGVTRFTPAQTGRLKQQLGFYPNLANMMDRLIPPSAS